MEHAQTTVHGDAEARLENSGHELLAGRGLIFPSRKREAETFEASSIVTGKHAGIS